MGIPELKKLLAIAQKEISTLKAQLAADSSCYSDSLPNAISGKTEPEALLAIDIMGADDDEDTGSVADELSSCRIRISELEELLEYERQR